MNSRATTKAILVVSLLAGLSSLAPAQGTWRVSEDSSGGEANNASFSCSVSADGRHVAFVSIATNLVPNDTNGMWDVFVHDRRTRTTTRVSVSSSGAQANGSSSWPSISADGQQVAFDSNATNLGGSNGMPHIYVHDRATGTTVIASVSSSGAQANWVSSHPSLSADGQTVAFASIATNLAPGDNNGFEDVFVHDLVTGSTTRASVDSAGREADDESRVPHLSRDGRYVAFESDATNLVSGDTNGEKDVFVHDRVTGVTTRVSVESSGTQGNDRSNDASRPTNRGIVAFKSFATNLVPGDTNGKGDVFLRDFISGTTTRVNLDSAGRQSIGGGGTTPKLSADGRMVAFTSAAANLVPGDTNAVVDVFLRDTVRGRTTRLSVDSFGAQADDKTWMISDGGISDDGRVVAFYSWATNLVPGDTNNKSDAFVHAPYLTLQASPEVAPPGTNLSLTTWGGMAAGPAMLYAVDVNGSPFTIQVAKGSFDAGGLWTLSATVPPGLSGNVVTFLSFGLAPDGRVGLTNQEAVTFL